MSALAGPARSLVRRSVDGQVVRWLSAYTLSLIGDGAWSLALGWAAREAAGPGHVGWALAAGAAPRAALMLWGGTLTDRFGARRVVLVSDGIRCLLLAGLAVALGVTGSGWWVALTGVAAVCGALDAVFLPAVAAMPAFLARPGQLGRLHGLRALAIRVGDTVGPAAGGVALAAGGAAAATAGVAALLALSLVLLAGLRPTGPDTDATVESSAAGRGVRDGLAYLSRRPALIGLLTSLALTELGAIPVINLGLILLAHRNGWGPDGAGWTLGGLGLGAALGALLIALAGARAQRRTLYCVVQFLSAVGLAGLAAVTSLPGATVVALATGAACGAAGAILFALVQAHTDGPYLGRIMAVVYLISLGLPP